MTLQRKKLDEGISRRNALKKGAIVTGGLAFGNTLIGSAGASSEATADIVAEHHFVRAADDSDPGSPVPDPQDRLVERREGNPVDDGTNESVLDGTHQLRWGEFKALNGRITMGCNGDGSTDVGVRVSGLVPNGLYTLWVIVFDSPGFDFDTRDIFPFAAPGTAGEHFLGAGPLGPQDGSENRFRARGSHGELSTTHPTGELAIPGPGPEGPVKYNVEGCLLEEFEVHIVGDYHLDGNTHGHFPGGPGQHVEHFGAPFQEGKPI